MKKEFKMLLLILAIGFVFAACGDGKKEEAVHQDAPVEDKHAHEHEKVDHGYEVAMSAYQCPMKCEGDKTYDEQGACPACKMDLKEIKVSSNNEQSSLDSKE